MPLGTLDRSPPPFFKQGPSALSKLIFFGALALFLMVADVRLQITQPLRGLVATAARPGRLFGADAVATRCSAPQRVCCHSHARRVRSQQA